jgi:hypothetical protein
MHTTPDNIGKALGEYLPTAVFVFFLIRRIMSTILDVPGNCHSSLPTAQGLATLTFPLTEHAANLALGLTQIVD